MSLLEKNESTIIYKVKKAPETISLQEDWDQGPWRDALALEL